MTNEDVEESFEVVWTGGSLLPPREQHPDPTWAAPKRAYNRRQPLDSKGLNNVPAVAVGNPKGENDGES